MNMPVYLLREMRLTMNEIAYFLSVMVGLGSIVAGAVLLWGAVEGVYFLYCKATGREY
jgi:fucose permease